MLNSDGSWLLYTLKHRELVLNKRGVIEKFGSYWNSRSIPCRLSVLLPIIWQVWRGLKCSASYILKWKIERVEQINVQRLQGSRADYASRLSFRLWLDCSRRGGRSTQFELLLRFRRINIGKGRLPWVDTELPNCRRFTENVPPLTDAPRGRDGLFYRRNR